MSTVQPTIVLHPMVGLTPLLLIVNLHSIITMPNAAGKLLLVVVAHVVLLLHLSKLRLPLFPLPLLL